MASNAFAGVGSQFKRADTDSSGTTFTAIAEVNTIGGPNMARDQIDVTSLDSTGGYKEFIGSFRDAGEVSLTMNFTRDGYILLKGDFELSDTKEYQIVLSDTGATTFQFTGIVTNMNMSVSTGDKVTYEATIKISGEPTIDS